MADILTNYPWANYNPTVHSLLKWRILCSESVASTLIALLAVWVAFWIPRYWRLLKFLLHISPSALPSTKSTVFQHLWHSRTPEEAILPLARRRRQAKSPTTLLALLFVSAAFVGYQFASISVSRLLLDNYALSTSQDCGFYVPGAESSIASPMDQIMDSVASYYQECYESSPSEQKCDIFTEQDLHVTYTQDVPCPFGDLCKTGAISMDTGLLDSVHLGINSPHRPKFRRTTVCAPLKTDGFYQASLDDATNYTEVQWSLGPRLDVVDNATYRQTRSLALQSIFSPTGIELKIVSEALGEFSPIPEIQSTQGYTLLAFLNIFNIAYPSPSHDPIFPATTATLCPNSNQTCYSSTQLPASVLACTEHASICPPDSSGPCLDAWSPNFPASLSSSPFPGAAETYLLASALRLTSFSSLLSTRHGLLLNATALIQGSRLSQPLSPSQWQLEASRLFSMSLLRSKFEILAVSRGLRAHEPGYIDLMPGLQASYKQVCGSVAFQAKGYVNLSLVGLACAVLGPLLVGFGMEVDGKFVVVWVVLYAVRCAGRRRQRAREVGEEEEVEVIGVVVSPKARDAIAMIPEIVRSHWGEEYITCQSHEV